jgi:hypothetical protein
MPITLLPMVVMFAAAPAAPASAREVPEGARVRVQWAASAGSRGESAQGRLVASDAMGLTVEEDGLERRRVRVPWPSVRSMEVRTHRTPAGTRLVKGIGLGVAIGAVAGLVLVEATDHGCPPGAWCLFTHGQSMEMGAAGLGMAGGFVGGLVGLAGGEHWSRVPVTEDRITVVPEIGRHGGGLRVAVRF